MPLPIMPADSDRVRDSIGAVRLELELAYRRLLSTDYQLVLDDIPVFGFGNLAGRHEPKQLPGDHYGLPAMLFPSGRTPGKSLTETGISLHVTISTVTQYLGWDLIQKWGQVPIFELGVLLVGRGVQSG